MAWTAGVLAWSVLEYKEVGQGEAGQDTCLGRRGQMGRTEPRQGCAGWQSWKL
jgi:hypothetical protein